MSTQTETLSSARWIHTPEEAMEAAQRSCGTSSSTVARPKEPEAVRVAPMKSVLDEFVSLIKDNPKVWAVCATQDSSGIHIWTYVDSGDPRDRVPIYQAEWQMLSLYPQFVFDFNAVLLPATSQQLETDETTYVYRR